MVIRMEKVYIFGHRNPDTDSITSSIALAYLKKSLGVPAEARTLGTINDETKFILKYFNVSEPKYLNDVKLKIKNIVYYKDVLLNQNSSIEETYKFLTDKNITGVPIVDDNKKFISIVTVKNILKNFFEENDHLRTSYDNILNTLKGEQILKFDHEIEGKISAVSYRSTTFLETITLNKEDILIVGDRHSIIEAAVLNKIKLLIITGNSYIKEEHINIAINNKVNIIKTPFNTFKTVKKIFSSNYVKNIISSERAYTIYEDDYYDDFLNDANNLGFNNYPVVDKNNICKGLIRLTEINKLNRLKVILVDHNESEQSVLGLDEADILEVIDHHKIGDISTNKPINFRNMAVGSTNTIIYHLYKENNVKIPYEIAGLMLSGIISDTLALTSPTTTIIDKEVVKDLEKITNLSCKDLSKEIFTNSLGLKNKSAHELLNLDMKIFKAVGDDIKVSQINVLSADDILLKKDELLKEIEEISLDGYIVILMITDILKNGSYFFYSKNAVSRLEKMCNKNIEQGFYLDKCVSRKIQVVPYIVD